MPCDLKETKQYLNVRKEREKKRCYCHACHRDLSKPQLDKTSILAKSCVLKDSYYRNQKNERVIYKL